MERGLVVCTDIDGLMQTLNINHNPLDWWLFIDSYKLSLKVVLFNKGNTIPSIPVGHSVHNKKSYENINILMDAINYGKSNGRSVVTQKWLPYYLDYNKDSKNLLLHLWMGQQSSVSSLLKKGLACQKISGTRNHQCGKSTTSGTE